MLKQKIAVTMIILALLTATTNGYAAEDHGLTSRPQVQQFIDTMVRKHQFDRQALTRLFAQARIHKKIIAAISRPAESKPWFEYRPIFITQKRISKGVEFWNEHHEELEKAEQRYGVPAEIITAILGVETFYGRHKGGYRVLDSLATLAFAYPKRSKFFLSELEQFLLMTREENIDPLMLKGSYAGAMGQPQFISSSFRRYAIDFDNDGKRDLWENSADAIGSVANYFKRHGWQKDEPIVSRANVKRHPPEQILNKGIKPYISIKALRKQGIHIAAALPENQQASLIELQQRNGKEYWVGMKNFYVITRYNHSALYAMAIYQLGQKIRALRSQNG